MSQYCYLNVLESTSVSFDDLRELNSKLDRMPGIMELLQNEMQTEAITTGFIKNQDNKIKFFDRESQKYSDSANVWGCVGKDDLDLIAEHMTDGKLVVEFDIEGWPAEAYILVPGSCRKAKISYD
jgi:hypothetical protein